MVSDGKRPNFESTSASRCCNSCKDTRPSSALNKTHEFKGEIQNEREGRMTLACCLHSLPQTQISHVTLKQSCHPPPFPSSAPPFAPSETKTTSPHVWKDEDQFKMICLMDANGITPQRLNYQSEAEERLSGSSSELRQSSSQVKEIRQRKRPDKDGTCYL